MVSHVMTFLFRWMSVIQKPDAFQFEYCNFEETEEILLKQDRTSDLIETLPVGSLNLNNNPAGQCCRIIATRNIDTCKTLFNAQVKVEGMRGGERNCYCYAFDFFMEYIKRVPDGHGEPTPVAQPIPEAWSLRHQHRRYVHCRCNWRIM